MEITRRFRLPALISLSFLCSFTVLSSAPPHPGYSLVYDRFDVPGNEEIFNAEIDGSNEVNLTNLAGDQYWVSCSAGGKKFAFYYNDPVGPQSDIYVMNRDGTGLANITNTTTFGQNEREPNWSPTDEFIAYVSNIGGYGGIDIIKPDGTGYQRVFSNTSTFSASAPSVSPGGSHIAFEGYTSGPNGGSRIYTVRLDGTGLQQVSFPATGYFDLHPDWGPPNGKYIAFHRTTGAVFDIWVVKSDGSGLEVQLTSTSDFEAFPAYSPDGLLITYGRRPSYNAPWIVYAMNRDGTGQTSSGRVGQHSDFCRGGISVLP